VFPENDYDALTLPMTVEDWCHAQAAVLVGPEPGTRLLVAAERFRREGLTLWVLGSSAPAITGAVPGLSPRLISEGTSNEELARTLEGPPEHYYTAVLTIYGTKVPLPAHPH
jgi:hypothetical protein